MNEITSHLKSNIAWRTALKWMLILLPLLLVAIIWMTDPIKPNNFLLDVPKVMLLSWLETPWTYFYLHLFTIIPVFLLSFDKNVHYYKEWKYLLPAIGIMGAIFIAWDVFFTVRGVWDFNHTYLSNIFLFRLPIEEWLFFLTVPFACVFIYECLNFYIKKDLLASVERPMTLLMSISFLIIGFFHWHQIYTATTFILTGFFVLYHFLFLDGSYRSRFYLAYLVSFIPFLIVNGVLTGGYTQEPIVIYNPEEYLGIRITSVPIDDSVYGFLLLFGTVSLFEKFRKNHTSVN